MFRKVLIVTACTFSALAFAATALTATPSHGAEPALDPIMGEFGGTLTLDGATVKAEAKVIADEDHKYRVVLLYPPCDAKAKRIELNGLGKDGSVAVSGDWTGTVTKDALELASKQGGKAEMKRVERKSPTLGQKPPAGAIVLLPFEEGKLANQDHWSNKQWVAEDDGSILTRAGDTKSDKDYGSYKLHVEFRVPFMPAARGQGRGNSGVYQHGRYEIQVLDSFGLTENPGECAAIYGQKPADINVSLPPGQWQTYDIDFTAPKFDASGKLVKGAIITVLHNGVKVHDAVEVKNVTGGAWGQPAKTGPVRLQDHGNPTRFRNIWIVPVGPSARTATIQDQRHHVLAQLTAAKKAIEINPDMLQRITAALPDKAPATPATPRKLLVFTRAKGFVHGSIPVAAKTFELMGKKTGAFEAVASDDLAALEADNLKQFDAVMMDNTTGAIFGPPPPAKGRKPSPEEAKGQALLKNLLDFVAGGKGICGVHSATDWSGWDAYGKMMGAQFAQHPYGNIVCKNEDPSNPINAAFDGKEFPFSDEIYVFKDNYNRKDKHVLLSIDVEKSKLGQQARKDHDYWVSWVRPYGQGRVFYCSLGHNDGTFANKTVLKHLLAGIQYAMGDLKAKDTP